MNKQVIQEHLISALQTFVATFLVVFGTTLSQGHVIWTLTFFSAIGMAAARAAIKEVFAQFAPKSLGGRVS